MSGLLPVGQNSLPSPERMCVVAGVIIHNKKCLLTRRRSHVALAGHWEIPGGKVEAGETLQHALVRELDEELGIKVTSSEFLQNIHHDNISLAVFYIHTYCNTAFGKEGQHVEWLTNDQIMDGRLLTPLTKKYFTHSNENMAWGT